MDNKKCPICNKDVIYMGNRARYCSPICRKTAKKTRDRVYRQNRNFQSSFLRCCNRCNNAYDQTTQGNNRYCQKCVDIMKAEPPVKTRECLTEGCDLRIGIKRKRCSKHQKEFSDARKNRTNKELRQETEAIQKAAKEKGITKNDFKIPKHLLERGNIHYHGYGDKL